MLRHRITAIMKLWKNGYYLPTLFRGLSRVSPVRKKYLYTYNRKLGKGPLALKVFPGSLYKEHCLPLKYLDK